MPKVDTMTTSHFSGQAIFVPIGRQSGRVRVIQRCAICGEKLFDSKDEELDVTTEMIAENGPNSLPIWPSHQFLRNYADEGRMVAFGPERDPRTSEMYMPDDLCIALVE
jgi:hypothetical protein